MAHRSLATRIWGPAASALRQHPGLVAPPPPPVPSRFVGTVHNQAEPLNNMKRIQQEAVSVLEMQYLALELEKAGKIAQQRAVELKQVRYQKKKARIIFGFTLVAIPCMSLHIARLK